MIRRLRRRWRLRMQLLGVRFSEFTNWLRSIDRRVRNAAIVDATVSIVAVTIGYFLKTNTPARLAWIPVIACWIYIQRLTAVNIWLGEVAMEGADRAATTLESWWDGIRRRAPWFLTWIIGRPTAGHTDARAPHAIIAGPHEERETVWHDTSLGGHVFHVISTIWMWGHVALYVCGWLDYWLPGRLSAIVMFSGVILLFVATEDFVNIKRWRRVYGIFVGVHVTLFIVMWTFRLMMPGSYDYVMAKFGYHETINQQAGAGINRRTGTDRWWREKLDKDEEALLNRQRWNQLDPVHHAWTDDDQQQLDAISEVRTNLKPEQDDQSESWSTSIGQIPEQHPGWLVVGGLLLLAAFSGSKSGEHHS